MSVSISQTPLAFTPAYNEMYFIANSTNISQCSFKYVFDIYKGGTYITRTKLNPRPATALAIFNPARILENYVTYDFNPTLLGSSSCPNSIVDYKIYFGEEYGLSGDCTTGTTVFSGLTSSSGYCTNWVVQYEDFPGYDFADHQLGNSASKFLTDAPSVQKIGLTEYATIGFLNYGSQPVYLRVTTYQSSGGTKTALFRNPSYSGATTAYKINQYGVGVQNINHIAAGLFVSGTTSGSSCINTSTDTKYDIKLLDSTFKVISETKTYQLDCTPTRYQKVRIAFLNRWGQFDYFTFLMISKRSLKIERDTFTKVLAYNYTVGQRGRTVLNSNIQESWKLQSYFMSEETSDWLESLWTTNEAFWVKDDGSYVPINLDIPSVEMKTIANDGLIQYPLDFTLAYDRYVQRG